LVERSVKDSDVTVVSIFLNPTQFNDKSDLEHYPQTLEADCEMLEKVGADYVFAPSVNEIYPTPDTRMFDFPPVTTVMEGAKRPGHFNGVCQVVSRLFDIVQPDKAYFGEKDWQQIAVIKRLVEFMGSNIEIVECPIVREESGLAMSSRNERLTANERKLAANIYKTLRESLDKAKTLTLEETRNWVISDINAHEGLEVEYFSIVDGLTLTDLDNWNDSPYVVGCITVYCGETPIRLIDHIKYKG
jgi:pantoate--beta-alanine ligase